MKIIFNNEEREYEEGLTLEDLVQEFKGNQRVSHVGAWVNNKMVRPDAYSKTEIQDGDTATVKRFAAGG